LRFYVYHEAVLVTSSTGASSRPRARPATLTVLDRDTPIARIVPVDAGLRRNVGAAPSRPRRPGALDVLRKCETLVSSELLAVESLRMIDRLRLQGALSAEEAASRRGTTTEWLDAVDLLLLRRPILARAAEPFPFPLGTLDALHLATALVWQDRMHQEIVMATHDCDLALAGRSFGLEVLGS
jgi:predicted nucleic acid-binding protein